MTTKVSLSAEGGHHVNGEIAEPAGSGKAGAIVLLQEWWGVNDHVRSLAKRAAEAGFLVLVPDLYHGKTTKDAAEAQKLMTELDTLHAVKDIRAAIAFAKAHERSNGKVGVMGFCMGGALTLATAAHVGTEIAAAVPFYGIPPAEKADLTKIAVPVQMHVGKHDAWVTPAKAEDVKSKVKAPFELHIYDADHAFVNDTRPEVYSPENAKLAWSRAMAFFEKHLAS